MTIRCSISVICTLFILVTSYSQNQVIKTLNVGDKVPQSIWKIIPKQKETKLVILDFWDSYCATCIEAFPKMEKLQKQFNRELQIILINNREDKSAIEKRLNTINNALVKNNSDPIRIPALAAINGENIISKYFRYTAIPHHVWINGAGLVKAITYGHNATPENVKAMLGGANIKFIVKNDLFANEVQGKGLLQPVSFSLPAVYYSAFTPYSQVGNGGHTYVDTIKKIFRYSFYNASLLSYFQNAFRMKNVRERILLEMKNKERYLQPNDDNLMDDWMRDFWFTYEIQGPLKDRENWQESMKIDVNRFFGSLFGIEGNLEKRKFKSLILIKLKDGLLTTKSEESKFYMKQGMDFEISNYSFTEVVRLLTSKLEDMNIGRPFIDETGFIGRVDMMLTGDLQNIDNVRIQLLKYGLDIIVAEREVEVLVIRDKLLMTKE